MMSKIVTDPWTYSELAHHGPENLFICILKIAGSVALLFVVNVPLTLVMLAVTAMLRPPTRFGATIVSALSSRRTALAWRGSTPPCRIRSAA